MIGNGTRWEKLGRILAPDPQVEWMSTFTGASFALPTDEAGLFDVYVTGRDRSNRSLIGLVRMSLIPEPRVTDVSREPVLSVGMRGAFDENGVSYPWVVRHDGRLHLYYTGWMPTVISPFQNHLGLAVQRRDMTMERVSRAPILERTNDDFLSTGSACVQVENGVWRMWYTAFTSWGADSAAPKHSYIIKYATSADGIQWVRRNQVCIDLAHEGEHSICHPTVYRNDGLYHMWYCYRGQHYRIGYAVSRDGISWTRRDDEAGMELSEDGWDSEAQCYPHVFRYDRYLYMLYCGNDYGRAGLGLARLKHS